jgi:hypothetical protein
MGCNVAVGRSRERHPRPQAMDRPELWRSVKPSAVIADRFPLGGPDGDRITGPARLRGYAETRPREAAGQSAQWLTNLLRGRDCRRGERPADNQFGEGIGDLTVGFQVGLDILPHRLPRFRTLPDSADPRPSRARGNGLDRRKYCPSSAGRRAVPRRCGHRLSRSRRKNELSPRPVHADRPSGD